MRLANERSRYNVMTSLIGWAHTWADPWRGVFFLLLFAIRWKFYLCGCCTACIVQYGILNFAKTPLATTGSFTCPRLWGNGICQALRLMVTWWCKEFGHQWMLTDTVWRVEFCRPFWYMLVYSLYRQCGAVVTRSIFSKIFMKDTPYLGRQGEVWGVFLGGFSLWLIFCPVPAVMCAISCWNIVKSNLRNKLQWNLKQNLYIFIQGIAVENVICKMAAILSQPQCVNINGLVQERRNSIANALELHLSCTEP